MQHNSEKQYGFHSLTEDAVIYSQSSFGPLDFAVLSPCGRPDARLPIAASRAGALGVLDLQLPCDRRAALDALRDLAERGRGRFGVQVADDEELLGLALEAAARPPDVVLLGGPRGRDIARHVALARAHGVRTFLIATSLEEALAGEAAGVDGVVAKGHEAAGWVGEESTFVLLQRLCAALHVPVWVQGGVGRHTAAACVVAGAEGAVLDAQVLLARETPLDEVVQSRLAGFDGSETTCLGADLGAPFRAYVRPDLLAATALAAVERTLLASSREGAPAGAEWRAAVEESVGWHSLDDAVLAVGQDACFAADLSRHGTVAGILDALADAAIAQCAAAASANPLAEGAPLAASHGTRYPLVQGPMTRVSDRAGFAAAVAEAGALPFLALALMRGDEVDALLTEATARLGDRPWGVGILGFVPPELREEQLACIRAHRPPFALIAGGRPAQARELEEQGIDTYLHVPSPGLLSLYLREGARRFVFEGRECGGHVGSADELRPVGHDGPHAARRDRPPEPRRVPRAAGRRHPRRPLGGDGGDVRCAARRGRRARRRARRHGVPVHRGGGRVRRDHARVPGRGGRVRPDGVPRERPGPRHPLPAVALRRRVRRREAPPAARPGTRPRTSARRSRCSTSGACGSRARAWTAARSTTRMRRSWSRSAPRTSGARACT